MIRHAHGADGAPPIDRTDLLRPPCNCAEESRAPSTGGRAPANGHASTPPLDGSTGLVLLAKGWRDWRSALIVVQPETVVRWHRQWLRRRWSRLSHRRCPGRPPTDSAIRALVGTMTAANPLWGAPRIGVVENSAPIYAGAVLRERNCFWHGDLSKGSRLLSRGLKKIKKWSGWPDSNRRPPDPQSGALTRLRYIP